MAKPIRSRGGTQDMFHPATIYLKGHDAPHDDVLIVSKYGSGAVPTSHVKGTSTQHDPTFDQSSVPQSGLVSLALKKTTSAHNSSHTADCESTGRNETASIKSEFRLRFGTSLRSRFCKVQDDVKRLTEHERNWYTRARHRLSNIEERYKVIKTCLLSVEGHLNTMKARLENAEVRNAGLQERLKDLQRRIQKALLPVSCESIKQAQRTAAQLETVAMETGTIEREIRNKRNPQRVKMPQSNVLINGIACGSGAQSSNEKVLLLVGATGGGKTTLINGLANYLMGVRWEDDFRYELIPENNTGIAKSQVHNQTSSMMTYTFRNLPPSRLQYTLTVIDTPGFGDTRGLEADQQIASKFKDFFSNTEFKKLHGIGFVAQAPSARLTAAQKYVFNSVFQLFGKDVADNILVMATFADCNKPPLLEALKDTNVPHNKVLKFNNCALYLPNYEDGDENGDLHKLYWTMGMKSFHSLCDELAVMDEKSIK